jgi:hypothetical protein
LIRTASSSASLGLAPASQRHSVEFKALHAAK